MAKYNKQALIDALNGKITKLTTEHIDAEAAYKASMQEWESTILDKIKEGLKEWGPDFWDSYSLRDGVSVRHTSIHDLRSPRPIGRLNLNLGMAGSWTNTTRQPKLVSSYIGGG